MITQISPRSFLTDEQWHEIQQRLPRPKQTGRRRSTDLRLVVAAIHFHWHTGCPWRKLPEFFPPWSTVYTYFRLWHQDGTLRELRKILRPPLRSQLFPARRPQTSAHTPF